MVGVKGKAGMKKRKSIIYSNNLQDTIVELHTRGMNYTEICRVINEKSDIKVNRMQISRFLAQLTPDDIKTNTITNLSGMRSRTIENNITILNDYDLATNDIITLIETSRLSVVDKGILKKQISAKLKQVRKNFVENRGELLDIFQEVNSTIATSNQFLLDVSKLLCSDCRKKVVKAVQDIEEVGDIRYNT
jgi:uncharacterized protein YwgA